MNMPQISLENEEIAKIEMINKANDIIDLVERFNNTAADNYELVEVLRERLIDITDSLLNVRIWAYDGILNCVVLYPDPNTMKMFRGE